MTTNERSRKFRERLNEAPERRVQLSERERDRDAENNLLPLASLRLLVPPLQLMAASMWQVLRKQDVRSYWKVADVVSLVADMVPELMMYKHWTQLNLGLRARYVIELCRNEQPREMILSYLEKMTSSRPTLVGESDDESVKITFFELIPIILKDPDERKDFFMDLISDPLAKADNILS